MLSAVLLMARVGAREKVAAVAVVALILVIASAAMFPVVALKAYPDHVERKTVIRRYWRISAVVCASALFVFVIAKWG